MPLAPPACGAPAALCHLLMLIPAWHEVHENKGKLKRASDQHFETFGSVPGSMGQLLGGFSLIRKAVTFRTGASLLPRQVGS